MQDDTHTPLVHNQKLHKSKTKLKNTNQTWISATLRGSEVATTGSEASLEVLSSAEILKGIR